MEGRYSLSAPTALYKTPIGMGLALKITAASCQESQQLSVTKYKYKVLERKLDL